MNGAFVPSTTLNDVTSITMARQANNGGSLLQFSVLCTCQIFISKYTTPLSIEDTMKTL